MVNVEVQSLNRFSIEKNIAKLVGEIENIWITSMFYLRCTFHISKNSKMHKNILAFLALTKSAHRIALVVVL